MPYKKLYLSFLAPAFFCMVKAQPTIYPAAAQTHTIALTHATIHTGNGDTLQNGMIVINNGKITDIKTTTDITGATIIDCSGKQIYPALIDAYTDLGLNEIAAVRSTLDENELGDLNPNIRSLIAYNTDSRIINTVRSNGILLANVVPDGGIISGSSSVMQLDAWNWEDAVYKADGGIHLRMPLLERFYEGNGSSADPLKEGLDKVTQVRRFFTEAKAYLAETKHEHTNIKFESVKNLFNKTQTLFVHCDFVKEMMLAVNIGKEFGFRTVIIGGTDSWKIAGYLKENNVGIILNQTHNLPVLQDDDVALPYKTPYLLQQAGVTYCIADNNNETRYRNMPFNAGTAVAYGLSKEQALQSITLNAAKLLGIDTRTGSLEIGKDANIIVSDGDILDMKTSNVIHAFIQGREINLDNKQKQLYEKYKYKYGIK